MKVLNFFVFQILSNETIFLGLVALLGLLLQRKSFPKVIDGTVKTVIGLTILASGAGILINSLSPVVTKLNETLHVRGVLPTNDAVFGVVLRFNTIAKDTVITFLLAFFLHLLLVRLTPGKNFKNAYLTAHLMLYHAAFMNVTLPVVLHTGSFWTVTVGTILNALYYTYSPAIPRVISRPWMHDVSTLGFMDQVGSILAHFIGKWFGSSDPNQDADNMKLPKWASMFRDNTIVLFFLMPIIFVGIGIAVGKIGIESLAGTGAGAVNWILWLILQGFTFTAGIVVLLAGVRTFIGSIVPAFKGISDKFLPGAIPALDAPTIFPYSPMGGMFGFLGSTVGCILVTFLTIVFHSPVIVFPSPIIMYFDGNVMGVFGNKAGGWRGAIAAGLITGIISSAAVILFYPLTGAVYGSGLTWSNIDYAIVWMPLMYLLKFLRTLILAFI
ncbi:PTS ascorbate transporter subunit IIC [Lentilactobacillus sp. G22-6]|uniref:PTS transporter subunit IIC n=1 Tax=Lentilactobacillus dabitei TaxID=2831523 RepID=UPI001C273ABC|nr:PTS transporter subunit IIC [Lentilactobacillus dabitei]MBU9788457.1 PTS ascorbate transporter subunit IIC [Lentilactobacillus dabitei]